MPLDYLHTEDDDLLIQDGDFVRGETTEQHQSLMVRLEKGELRLFPKTGVGINSFLQDDNPGDVYQEIQRQLEADGLVVRDIDVSFDEQTNSLNVTTKGYYP